MMNRKWCGGDVIVNVYIKACLILSLMVQPEMVSNHSLMMH